MLALKLGMSLTSSNKPSTAAGFLNEYSLDFDGTNDYVTFGDATVFTPNSSGAGRGFSIGLWFKTTDASTGGFPPQNIYLLGKIQAVGGNSEYTMQVDSTGKISLKLFGNGGGSPFDPSATLTTSTALNDGNWKHIIFTWDLGSPVTTSNFKVYVNGSQDTSATIATSGTLTSVKNALAPLTLAVTGIGGISTHYLEGKLDEVFIVDDALSSSQVTDIYNGGTPIDMTTINHLVGWWRNGDPTGTGAFPTIVDASSNSNDGTMTNMASGDIVTDVP